MSARLRPAPGMNGGAGGAYVPTVFVGMYATRNGRNHLHYSTTNIQEGGIARACLTPSVFGSNGFRLSASCGGN
jgi:hypothetical protein